MLLRTCEFVDNRHTVHAEEVLWDICDTVARIGAAIVPYSSAGLVLGVEHAQQLAAAGFSKAEVQRWLSEHAVRDHDDLGRAGKHIDGTPPNVDEHGMRMVPDPAQIPIVVAGARNAAMSMVIRPFGFGGWARQPQPIRRESRVHT
jgi:hypothetical protein